ncbi:pilus assembly protein PilP [Alcanivorax sp. IL2]|uniref:pilus assembly protein PilP n=1 Tax=Alcanivorax sp. IL2 TaxID=3396310 RepID=UPI0039C38991
MNMKAFIHFITSFPATTLGLCLLSATPAATAACMRLDPFPAADASTAPDTDGPGAFGALHDTLTLECLRYVDLIQKKEGSPVAQVQDNHDRLFSISVGDFVGENAGRVIAIEPERIVVRQLVPGPEIGDWKAVERYLFRMPSE